MLGGFDFIFPRKKTIIYSMNDWKKIENLLREVLSSHYSGKYLVPRKVLTVLSFIMPYENKAPSLRIVKEKNPTLNIFQGRLENRGI